MMDILWSSVPIRLGLPRCFVTIQRGLRVLQADKVPFCLIDAIITGQNKVKHSIAPSSHRFTRSETKKSSATNKLYSGYGQNNITRYLAGSRGTHAALKTNVEVSSSQPSWAVFQEPAAINSTDIFSECRARKAAVLTKLPSAIRTRHSRLWLHDPALEFKVVRCQRTLVVWLHTRHSSWCDLEIWQPASANWAKPIWYGHNSLFFFYNFDYKHTWNVEPW